MNHVNSHGNGCCEKNKSQEVPFALEAENRSPSRNTFDTLTLQQATPHATFHSQAMLIVSW